MESKKTRKGQSKPGQIGRIANMIKILSIIPISKFLSLIFLFHLAGKKISTRTVVNQGKYVMMKRPIKRTNKKGAKERNIFPTSICAKLQAMNIPMPMGGRKIPMPRHAMHNIPKWI